MGIVLELAQPALLIINVTLQSPRQVLKSGFPVSTILPPWPPVLFQLALPWCQKSPEKEKSEILLSKQACIAFQQLQSLQPRFVFMGSAFCLEEFWIASVSGKTSSVQLASERNMTTFQSDACPSASIPHPLQILTLIGIEKGITVAQAWPYPHSGNTSRFTSLLRQLQQYTEVREDCIC